MKSSARLLTPSALDQAVKSEPVMATRAGVRGPEIEGNAEPTRPAPPDRRSDLLAAMRGGEAASAGRWRAR